MNVSARFLVLVVCLVPVLNARTSLSDALAADPVDGLVEEILPTPGDLLMDGSEDVSLYGTAIAVRGDRAAVGAPVNSDFVGNDPGSVYLFRRGNSGWFQVQKLVPPDAVSGVHFGTAVAFDESGSILVVGADDDGPGGVTAGAYVFELDPGSGAFGFVQKLVPADYVSGDHAGREVAVSGDWIVVGSPFEDIGTTGNEIDTGDLTLFEREGPGGLWIERQSLGNPPPQDNLPDEIGDTRRFAISGDVLAYGADLQGDGTIISVNRLDPGTGYWSEAFTYFTTSLTAAYWFDPVFDVSPAGILTPAAGGRDPELLSIFRPSGSGDPWQGIDTTVYDEPDVTYGVLTESLFVAPLVLSAEIPQADGLEIYAVGDGPITLLGTFADAQAIRNLAADDGTILYSEFNPGPESQLLVAAAVANEPNLVARARSLMFYEDAEPGLADEAAFAYQTLLYTAQTGSDGLYFSTRHAEIETLYGAANRNNADLAEAILRSLYPNVGPERAVEVEQRRVDPLARHPPSPQRAAPRRHAADARQPVLHR